MDFYCLHILQFNLHIMCHIGWLVLTQLGMGQEEGDPAYGKFKSIL